MRRFPVKLAISVFLLLLIGGQMFGGTSSFAAQDQIQVVTSLELLADWVEAIGGPYVKVASIIPGRTSPHHFEPSVKHLKMLQEADLYVEIGLDLEPWSNKLLKNVGNRQMTRLILSEKLPPACKYGSIEHQLGIRKHSQCNPHIWLDAPNVTQAISVITQYLNQIYPEQAQYFTATGLSYLETVDTTFCRYKMRLKKSQHAGKLAVVTTVPTYTFLLRDLGVNEIGPLEKGHGSQPSAKQVAELVAEAKAQKAVAVISEEGFDHGFGRILAEETGLPLVYLAPLPEPGQSYLDFLENNLEKLTAVLE